MAASSSHSRSHDFVIEFSDNRNRVLSQGTNRNEFPSWQFVSEMWEIKELKIYIFYIF